jgi:hypothetical protein
MEELRLDFLDDEISTEMCAMDVKANFGPVAG